MQVTKAKRLLMAEIFAGDLGGNWLPLRMLGVSTTGIYFALYNTTERARYAYT